MDLSYPIGKFQRPAEVTPQMRAEGIAQIAAAPGLLREAVEGLKDGQLDAPYRPEGWTVRQVVHHVADSHMHSNIRMRFALTSAEPTIMAYPEGVWAELADARNAPVETSLVLLENLHHRWVTLLKSLSDADFARAFRHPEMGLVRLDTNVMLYAWHGRHHTAHITRLRDRMGW
jgi:uncharacterized damage-inducible protein DinB